LSGCVSSPCGVGGLLTVAQPLDIRRAGAGRGELPLDACLSNGGAGDGGWLYTLLLYPFDPRPESPAILSACCDGTSVGAIVTGGNIDGGFCGVAHGLCTTGVDE